MKLSEIVVRLDGVLRVGEVKDYPNALNGLQVTNEGEVRRVVVAVDACEYVIQQAVDAGADLLIVHHGLFWGGLEPVTGARHRKLGLCLKNNLAVYSAHLPLDEHPVLGNNARLCDAIGLSKERKIFMTSGFQVEEAIDLAELVTRVERAVGGPVHLAPGGPKTTARIGVVTGGAGSGVAKAAAEGVDTFITGEGPHHTYTLAEELGVNLIYAGHYATETFGVKALGQYLEQEYRLPWSFIDHPTGL